MQFNDTTTYTGICQDINFLLGLLATDTTTYATTDKARNVNVWYRKVVALIWEKCGDWEFDDTNASDLPVATTGLIINQRDYTLPANYGKVDRVEVKDSDGNWGRLKAIDKSQVKVALSEFMETTGTPMYYDLFANSMKLFPASDETRASALRIYVGRDIDEFTSSDTTQEPGFNKNFHRILSYGAALDYAVANGLSKKIPILRAEIVDMEKRISSYYDARNKDLSKKHLIMSPKYNKRSLY